MDPQLKQRLIGAAVLVSLAVLIIPAFLDQDRPAPPPVVARDMAPMPVYEFPETPAPVSAADEALIRDGLETPFPPPEGGPGAGAVPSAPMEPLASPKISAEETPVSAEAPLPSAPAPELPPPTSPLADGATRNPAGTAAGGWVIQLGSFSSRGNADSLRARLIVEGYDAFVSPLAGSGYTSFRVRVRAAGDRARADQLASRLKQTLGYAGIVLRDE